MHEAKPKVSSLNVEEKLIDMINLICHEDLGGINKDILNTFIEINSTSLPIVEDICIKWVEKQDRHTCELLFKRFLKNKEETSKIIKK